MNNFLLASDAYKGSHYKQLPRDAQASRFYLAPRKPLSYSNKEAVIIGFTDFIRKYMQPVTHADIEEAKGIWNNFNIAGTKYPFPFEQFQKIIDNGGKLPLNIYGVAEGSIISEYNTPIAVVEVTDPDYIWLPGFLETSFQRAIWYPSTVASNSRNVKLLLADLYEKAVDEEDFWTLDSRLHDFGGRGVSSGESAAIGGMAHLVNFMGTDTMEGARLIKQLWPQTEVKDIACSIPACYDEQTDILTSRGFIKFEQLKKTDLVAQYNEDNTIDFVIPLEIQNSKYSGPMEHFYTKGNVGKVDLLVTPNHRMVRRSLTTGKIEIQEANKAKFSDRNIWIQAGEKNGEIQELETIDKLKIAFQADGSFASHSDDYTGSISGGFPIRFSLKKKRKINRLIKILDELGFSYTLNKSGNNKPGYTIFWIVVPGSIQMSKTFDWVNIIDKGTKWCKEFIEECAEWDGTRKFNTITYSTTIEYNAQVVHMIGILSNYRTSFSFYDDKRENRKRVYNILVSKTSSFRKGTNIFKKTFEYEGMIHCVTVPSGMVIVRRNGIVSVSGNSEHSTVTSWGPSFENELEALDNMIEQFGHGVFAFVSDSYDYKRLVDHGWGDPERIKRIREKGGMPVVRPDSGDPVEMVLYALNSLSKTWGFRTNKKNYKILDGIAIIQGDGMTPASIKKLYTEIVNQGWSPQNLAVGMGGGLLQKVNRDDQSWSMKMFQILRNGIWENVQKDPVTQKDKIGWNPNKGINFTNWQTYYVGCEGKPMKDLPMADTDFAKIKQRAAVKLKSHEAVI